MAGVAFVLLVFYLLFVELQAVAQGGHSTISELVWLVWATQPWVVLIVSHVMAAPFWFLCGHFFAQARDVYDAIRKGGE